MKARRRAWKIAQDLHQVEGEFEDKNPTFFKVINSQGQAISACADGIFMASQGHREYIIDSGASNHLVAKNQLHENEKETIRPLDVAKRIQCANGTMTIKTMAQIYVPFLEKSVWAYVMRDCPTILSLGMLCNEEGWNYSWQNGKDPVLWKDKVVIRLHSKQQVPVMYAAASTGNDLSTGHGSKCHTDSVKSSNSDPPHSTQSSSTSQSSYSSSTTFSCSITSEEEADEHSSSNSNSSSSFLQYNVGRSGRWATVDFSRHECV